MSFLSFRIERFSFLGLNPNESACILLYAITIIWVITRITKSVTEKLILTIIELILIVIFSQTMSRGGLFTLICSLFLIWWLDRKSVTLGEYPKNKILSLFFYNPIWRILLALCNIGMWQRSSLGYIIQDISITNRFVLWEGAIKMIVSSPVDGWGNKTTGLVYMNWFQDVGNYTFYNGLVNSYLQIGVAWGILALFIFIFILVVSIKIVMSLAVANYPLGTLGLLIILIWSISSIFSNMTTSNMLYIPPLIAAIGTILVKFPNVKIVISSTIFSILVCAILLITGKLLELSSSTTIKKENNGIITLIDTKSNSNKVCYIYIDKNTLGKYYGKEVRKLLTNIDIKKFKIIEHSEIIINDAPDLIILSGVTTSYIIKQNESRTKYILLNPLVDVPAVIHNDIRAIIIPEIYKYLSIKHTIVSSIYLDKVIKVPFNEPFESSWSKYIKY
jgi:hypothetical protein